MKYRILQTAPDVFIPERKGWLFWYSFGIDEDSLFDECAGIYWPWDNESYYGVQSKFETLEKAQKFLDGVVKLINTPKPNIESFKPIIHSYTPKVIDN